MNRPRQPFASVTAAFLAAALTAWATATLSAQQRAIAVNDDVDLDP